ncbi:MAG: AarF/UbiB family protein [Planctomycetota bacterium]
MKITAIPQLYRNLKRWRGILAILNRYGLADWLTATHLPFRDRFKGPDGEPLSDHTRAERLRLAITELGPTFVKVGQTLAGRPDLLGPEYIDELKELRSRVPPEPIQAIEKVLDANWPEDWRANLSLESEALGTASIGQVHRGTFNDGRKVVVKVRRPGIASVVRQDLEILAGVAPLAQRIEGLAAFDPVIMVEQLSRVVISELDFNNERRNLQYFRSLVESDFPDIRVPWVDASWCTEEVLVMEEVEGVSLNQWMSKAGNPENVESMARKLADFYLRLLIDEGVFHADPHPGNFIVGDDGQLGIIDFGMVGRLDDGLRDLLEEMLLAIGAGDQQRLTKLIRRLAGPSGGVDTRRLHMDVANFIVDYGAQDLGDFRVGAALEDLGGILRRHSIQLPPQTSTLLKMLISLEGTLREMGAGFGSIEVAQRMTRSLIKKRLSPKRRARQVRHLVEDAQYFLQTAPEELTSLMHQFRSGEIRINLMHRRLAPMVNRIVLGGMASAVFLGSSLMLALQVPPVLFQSSEPGNFVNVSILGLLGVLGSSAVMAWVTVAIARSGQLTRQGD